MTALLPKYKHPTHIASTQRGRPCSVLDPNVNMAIRASSYFVNNYQVYCVKTWPRPWWEQQHKSSQAAVPPLLRVTSNAKGVNYGRGYSFGHWPLPEMWLILRWTLPTARYVSDIPLDNGHFKRVTDISLDTGQCRRRVWYIVGH